MAVAVAVVVAAGSDATVAAPSVFVAVAALVVFVAQFADQILR